MGAADLHDVFEFGLLLLERVADTRDRRNQPMGHLLGGRNMHRSRKGIVGRLRHIDMVVGMNRVLAPHLAAGHFDCAVRDDLVGVHVGLGAAAGLPDA